MGRLTGRGCGPTGASHSVGGAIASRARPRVSEPICVTATAATASMTAIVVNTAGTPQVVWMTRKPGTMIAAPKHWRSSL